MAATDDHSEPQSTQRAADIGRPRNAWPRMSTGDHVYEPIIK